MKHLILTLTVLLAISAGPSAVRKPAKAGMWYPRNPEKLKTMLEKFFAGVDLPDKEKQLTPRIIVSPHAGFVYSGQVAAYGYSLLSRKQFDTVIVIGPSHHHMNNIISVFNGTGYRTPLGTVPVNRPLASKIIALDENIRFVPEIHAKEHSIEAQVPFLQHRLKEFSIVPILVSTKNRNMVKTFGKKLAKLIKPTKEKILIVVSTDLSHYHPYDEAVSMDSLTLNLMRENKSGKLLMKIRGGSCEMCGYFPWVTADTVADVLHWEGRHLLKYMNSGDVMKQSTSRGVVGYSSLVITEKAREQTTMDREHITQKDKSYLLDLARRTITHRMKTGKRYEPPKPENTYLNKERAVFVTLKKNGELRGCIGQLRAVLPLYRAVNQMALSAAFNDGRFPPVKKKELDEITIEISLLTPLKKIDDYRNIVMKKHGVVIKKGYRSGVFLPQVAQETGWDRKTFLENLCARKAGLPKDAYKKEDIELYTFRVIKFHE